MPIRFGQMTLRTNNPSDKLVNCPLTLTLNLALNWSSLKPVSSPFHFWDGGPLRFKVKRYFYTAVALSRWETTQILVSNN